MDDDPGAVADSIRQHYERWVAVANQTQPRDTDARRARLERLEDLITNQLKFTRADTQGNVNAGPIKLLILEQAKLEKEIEEEKEAQARELQAANEELLSALHNISPQTTPGTSTLPAALHRTQAETPTSDISPLNPITLNIHRSPDQAPLGSPVFGDGDDSRLNHDANLEIRQNPPREAINNQPSFARAQQSSHLSSQKRLPSTPLATNHQQKRPRLEEEPPSLTPGRSIEFSQVFQNGRATVKYRVVRFPSDTGHWYILECKDCNLSFDEADILAEATLHLIHGHAGSFVTAKDAIAKFGTRVLNCTHELASSNNDAFERTRPHAAVNNLSIPPLQPGTTPRGRRPEKKKVKKKPYQWTAPKDYSEVNPEVMNPQPGDIFACWQKPKGFYPVMILPWGRFERFDFEHTLQHTGLNEEIPICYSQARKTDTSPRPWANTWEDHGSRAHKRQYPVLFFDRVDFPIGCSVGWVPLHDLKVFDKSCPHTLRKELVEEYLDCQAECDAEKAEEEARRGQRSTEVSPLPRPFRY
ncbi:hypothetical protein N0V84_006549 [Fusarium piperis]|uniref:Uncharacterized protein n=1 Tax=Fusarium piperis TaxID=1435070 RepID=A0A9W8WBN3_9HYPO|nr:hypothetical protein N0V84_006549 [Fusarium piperis]